MLKIYFRVVLFLLASQVYGQSINFQDAADRWVLEKLAVKNSFSLHSDIGPYFIDDYFDSLKVVDDLTNIEARYLSILGKKYCSNINSKGYWARQINNSAWNTINLNLFEKRIDRSLIVINPIFNFEFGNTGQDRHFINTRGLELYGHISNKVGVYTMLRENQYFFPEYLDNHIDYYARTIPGQGRSRYFKKTGYDLSESESYITYNPIKPLNFKFGKYKNFIGNGHRSLLLSENSNSYLNLNMRLNLWKFQYQTILAELQDYPNYIPGTQLLKRKYAAFHYLSIKPSQNFSFGFFESVVFDRGDSTSNGFIDPNYLNPFIMLRSTEYYIGSPDNAILGINTYWNLLKNYQLYGQIVLDEFNVGQLFKNNRGWWANKYAVQIGAKAYDFGGIDDFDIQLENNLVRPFMYSYRETNRAYSNASQPLAHPLGSNFMEQIAIIRFALNQQFTIYTSFVNANKGMDLNAEDNNGGDISKSYFDRNADYGNVIGQGVANNIQYASLLLSYEVAALLNIDAGLICRKDNILASQTLFRIGLRYNMSFRHFDY